MADTHAIPERKDVAQADTWDLSKLFLNDEAWNDALGVYDKMAERIPDFKGTLGTSAETLADWLDFTEEFGILEERLGYYADLRQNEDEGASEARTMTGRFMMAASRAQAEAAWATPEIQTIETAKMEVWLLHPRLSDYVVYLKKILRWKPFILSEKEERILAMQTEISGTPHETFSILTNVDIDFGEIETPEGKRPLSQSAWSAFMERPERDLRERAYRSFYRAYDSHKNTIATLYSGQVKQDVYQARVRGFKSARDMALFPDKVEGKVYDALVSTVNANLAPLHRYYELRKKALGLNELRHWDVYAPLVQVARKETPWNEAVQTIAKALSPLGDEYVETLKSGLLNRWADRYENKGKRSGAFSAGSYTGDPYILMNYKSEVIRDLFTLAHEGGHSMHSWYSAKNNPFLQYSYTIFEAEVASTFNEELLFRHLEKNAGTGTAGKEIRTYLVNKRLDDLLATLYRQTMFAEFETITHSLYEGGKPLTTEVLRAEYRKLLEKYFGPAMVFEAESDLEGLRIPHFYRSFYVYKYATGVSASLALADRVAGGGKQEREDYFSFLKSGGSRFPIEALRIAGVDMASPEPVEAACRRFAKLVTEFETLL